MKPRARAFSPTEVEDHHRYGVVGVVHPEQSEEYVIPSGPVDSEDITRLELRELYDEPGSRQL